MPPASRRGSRPCCRSGCAPASCGVRTLLAGMRLAQADHRPAHLTRVHQALISLHEDDQAKARSARGRGNRPAPADLPADRIHLRPGHGCLGDEPHGLPSGPLQSTLR